MGLVVLVLPLSSSSWLLDSDSVVGVSVSSFTAVPFFVVVTASILLSSSCSDSEVGVISPSPTVELLLVVVTASSILLSSSWELLYFVGGGNKKLHRFSGGLPVSPRIHQGKNQRIKKSSKTKGNTAHDISTRVGILACD